MRDRPRLSASEVAEQVLERQTRKDRVELMADARFQRFMFDVLLISGYMQHDYVQGRADTAFAVATMVGRRSLGVDVLRLLEDVEPRALSILSDRGSLIPKLVIAAEPQEETNDRSDPYDPDDL